MLRCRGGTVTSRNQSNASVQLDSWQLDVQHVDVQLVSFTS